MTCPHGDPIPTRDGIMPEIRDRPMTVVPTDTLCVVSRVKERTPEKLKYLADIGLVPDANFKILGRGPFNGPLRLEIGQQEHILSAEMAAAIWVKMNDEPSLK